MDLVRLAYYPFLPEVREAVRELGPDVASLLSSPTYFAVRKRGRARVEGALGDGIAPVPVTDERSALHELLSVPIARMLVTVFSDRWLAARYAAAEAARVADTLRRDADPEAVARAAESLGVALVQAAEGTGGAGAGSAGRGAAEALPYKVHFSEFLRHSPERDSAWKLVVRTVERGFVPLSRDDAVTLCATAFARRIEAELAAEREKGVPSDLREGLAAHVEALAPVVAQAKEKFDEGDFGPVRRELFPPCTLDLFQQMKDGKNVPHHGRFALASFLATIGMGAEQIMAFYQEIPNFSAEKSRYQIEHIAGERGVSGYTPPGCAWMQTNGVCPLEKRDALCFKVKHPLSYYRARLRFDREAQEKGAQMVAEAKAKAAGAVAATGAAPGPGVPPAVVPAEPREAAP